MTAHASSAREEYLELQKQIQRGQYTAGDILRLEELESRARKEFKPHPFDKLSKTKLKLRNAASVSGGFGVGQSTPLAAGDTCTEFNASYYEADVLPWGATDNWGTEVTEGHVALRDCLAVDSCDTPGVLVLGPTAVNASDVLARLEPGLATERLASVSFRMRGMVTEKEPTPGDLFYGGSTVWIDDGSKAIIIAFTEDLDGNRFVLLAIEGHPIEGDLNISQVLAESFDWGAWHEYHLVRDTEGDVALFADGMAGPILSYPYAALNMETVGFWGVMFGNVTENAAVNSEWDYVRYNIGRSQPGGCVSADGKMELLSLISGNKLFNPNFDVNWIGGQTKINSVEGLASNTQSHRFFLRTRRTIRNASGAVVRTTLDDAEIGLPGKEERSRSIMATARGEWDGRDSLGNVVDDGTYRYDTTVSFVRVDKKGAVKTISSVSAPGSLAVASAPVPALMPTCATAPNWTSVPFGFLQQYWPVSDISGKYQNNLHWSEPILMSANVVKYRLRHRVLRPITDDNSVLGSRDRYGLEVGPAGGSWSYRTGTLDKQQGDLLADVITPATPVVTNAARTFSRGGLKFDSDADGKTAYGLKFDVLDVQCDNDGQPGSGYLALLGQAIDIVLHSVGQVVYFWTYAPYKTELIVTMKTIGSPPFGNSDFKIYGDWFSREKTGDFRWRGSSPFGDGAFKVSPSSNVNKKVFFAVEAVEGAGTVRVHLSPVYEKARIPLKVCTEYSWYDATPAERVQMKFALKRGAEAWFAMTDGQSYISNMDLWLNGFTAQCDVYFLPSTGRSQCHECPSSSCPTKKNNEYVQFRRTGPDPDGTTYKGWDGPSENRGWVFAHELGHLKACLKDEYFTDGSNKGKPFCGHSIMGSQGFRHDMCGIFNHCQDPEVANSNCWGIQSDAWSKFNSVYPVAIPRAGTADPSDFFFLNQFHDTISPITVRSP
ncbi:MAG: hypothetical protein HY851_04185 [candidate division Zixibacteria bacterium]|nr:hypothetical protein [candidate division Zixibacteria bacterium]